MPARPADVPAAAGPSRGIGTLPEREFDFVAHKEQVRRHLKAHLHYPSFLCAEARGGASSSAGLSDGTVRLRVILGPEGDFRQAAVLQASDPRLIPIAIEDARLATPYPRFAGIRRPRRLHYEFWVRYKPE